MDILENMKSKREIIEVGKRAIEERAIKLKNEGYNLAGISEALQIHESTVLYIFKKRGLI